MNRDEKTAKEKILNAAIELISEGKTDKQITMRQIALKAGVNLALVNYYYQSKDNLLSQVVGIIMGGLIEHTTFNTESDALTRLRNMLLITAEAAFKYRNITKIAVSSELKFRMQEFL
jgi:AcrR family transcriptional regulator